MLYRDCERVFSLSFIFSMLKCFVFCSNDCICNSCIPELCTRSKLCPMQLSSSARASSGKTPFQLTAILYSFDHCWPMAVSNHFVFWINANSIWKLIELNVQRQEVNEWTNDRCQSQMASKFYFNQFCITILASICFSPSHSLHFSFSLLNTSHQHRR